MSLWNPRSYVAEAVGMNRKYEADASFVPSYYDYTAALLRKRTESGQIEQALVDEYASVAETTLDICGEHVRVYSSNGVNIDSIICAAAAGIDADVEQSRATFEDRVKETLQDLASRFNVSVDTANDSGRSARLRPMLILDVLCRALEGQQDILINCGHCQVAFPGRSWSVGVQSASSGEDDHADKCFVKYETLNCSTGSRVMAFGPVSKEFERSVSICLTFFGDDTLELFCFLEMARGCRDYQSLLPFLRACAKTPSVIANFYCDGNDGFEASLDSFLEDDEEKETSGTNVWNMKQYILETVRTGNCADTRHLLETQHNAKLFETCRQVQSKLPLWKVIISVHLEERNVVIEEVFDSFQFLNRQRNAACVAVQHCSPLFNYLYAEGCHARIKFVTEGVTGSPKVLEVPSGAAVEADDSYSHFFVKVAYSIGDCAVVSGSFEMAPHLACIPVMMRQIAVNVERNATFVSPYVATLIHNTFGRVGFSGYGCSIASNFPPVLALVAPFHFSEFPLEESSVDPNITVHFFAEKNTPLVDRSYEEMFERLPLMLSDKNALREDTLAMKIQTRLLRISPDKDNDCVIVLAAVSAATFYSADVWAQTYD